MAKAKEETTAPAAEVKTSIENAVAATATDAPAAEADTSTDAPVLHASDCAVHNEPADPAGACDCALYNDEPATDAPAAEVETSIENAADLSGQDTTEGGDQQGADILPPAEPVVTQGNLRDMIARIEERNTDMHREALVADLVDNYQMTSDDGLSLTLLGLTVTRGAASPGQMLTTWCSKARRAILSGEVPA